jgi:hypothetical protein
MEQSRGSNTVEMEAPGGRSAHYAGDRLVPAFFTGGFGEVRNRTDEALHHCKMNKWKENTYIVFVLLYFVTY